MISNSCAVVTLLDFYLCLHEGRWLQLIDLLLESVSTGLWRVPGFGAGFIFTLKPSELQNYTENPGKDAFIFCANQEWPRQTKPRIGQFMNFPQGHSGTKVQCESCLFSQGKTPEFTKMGKFMNFSFWPFLWFGLPGRLLSQTLVCTKARLVLLLACQHKRDVRAVATFTHASGNYTDLLTKVRACTHACVMLQSDETSQLRTRGPPKIYK